MKREYLEKSIIILLEVILFVLLNYFIFPNTFSIALISFITISSFQIFFYDQLTLAIRKLFSYNYSLQVESSRTHLENLNQSLNGLVTYKEITTALQQTFTAIFKDTPWMFYIYESGQYYLNKSEHIDTPPQTIEKSDQEDIFKRRDHLHCPIDHSSFYKETVDEQVKTLEDLYAFPGQNNVIAFLLLRSKSEAVFKDRKTLKLFNKIQKKAGISLENSTLFYDLKRRNRQIKQLFDAGEKVLSSLQTEQILDYILMTLKNLIPYDAAAIFLLDKSGDELLSSNSIGYTEDHNKKLHLKIDQGVCGWVAKNKKMDISTDVRTSSKYYSLREKTLSQITIPLLFNGQTLGVLSLESNHPAFFTEDEAEILNLFGHLAATAIHNAEQFEVELTKKAFEHELVNAAAVQRRLLIQRIPKINHLSIAAKNIPSKIVSGDMFDIIRYDDDTAGVAIGDVSGKGAPAALMMSLLLAGLRTHKKTFLTVCDLVYRLNNLLAESTIEGKYATFFYGVFSMKEYKLYYTNAGHNPPIYFKKSGEIIELKTGGIVLGFIEDYNYEQVELPLDSGDLFLAFTDGITETMNAEEEEFGEQRLIELIKANREKSVQEIKRTVIDALKAFSGFTHNEDDVTIVIIKIE